MKEYNLSCVVRKEGSTDTAYIESSKENVLFSYEEKSSDEISKTYIVKISNCGESDFSGVIHIKAEVSAVAPKIFMPGYMYNNNSADMKMDNRKEFPRIKRNPINRCESPFWMTRADRLAEPVSLVYDNGEITGISAAPFMKNHCGFTCNVNDGNNTSVGFTLGYENAPFLFVQTATVVDREAVTKANSFTLLSKETFEFELTIYNYLGSDERDINKAIKHAYFKYHQAPRSIEGMTEEKALSLLSGAIRDYAWLEDENMYTGFVYDRPDGYAYNKIGSLSWTNGLAVAVPMLMAANTLNDEVARNQALKFIKNVTDNAFNASSNLLFDAVADGVWSVNGWWYSGMRNGGHSAYINGQAVYYILKAYVSEKEKRGVCHDDWLSFVTPVIKQMNSQIDTEYEYPFAFSKEDGKGIEYDSMGGAWCLAATVYFALITKTHEYDEILKKSEQHYFDKYVRLMECYGGPLDTDKAVDDEGILPYIRVARMMHELYGDKKYLEHLRDAIYYECTFKLGYNTAVSVRPLSEIKWSSCGGSITSTANPHIHPMSSTVINEMKYYVRYEDDKYVEERLLDTIKWGLQTFNSFDKEYGYGRVGWMSERFCFCQGLLTEKYPDGEIASTWFALMPWAAASVIEGMV